MEIQELMELKKQGYALAQKGASKEEQVKFFQDNGTNLETIKSLPRVSTQGQGGGMQVQGVNIPLPGGGSMRMAPPASQKERNPMAAESALRYSGAIQSIKGLQTIAKEIGIDKDGKLNPKAKELIFAANQSIEGANATNQGKGLTQFIPGGVGLYKGYKYLRGGDKGSKLGSYFMTTAENLLRARTGAAAPEPEIVREYARGLLRSYIESPDTWKAKLAQEEEFAMGIVKEMKPNGWEQDLGEQSRIFSSEPTQPSDSLANRAAEILKKRRAGK